MDILPPPPPMDLNAPVKTNWKKEEKKLVSKSGKVILILARYTFPFHNWINEDHLRIMITPKEAKMEISGDIKKKFAHIEYVENYESSGMVKLEEISKMRRNKKQIPIKKKKRKKEFLKI